MTNKTEPHEGNALLAQNLRVFADHIERSRHEYKGEITVHSGRTIFKPKYDDSPIEFGPVCYTLLIGDAEFVAMNSDRDVS